MEDSSSSSPSSHSMEQSEADEATARVMILLVLTILFFCFMVFFLVFVFPLMCKYDTASLPLHTTHRSNVTAGSVPTSASPSTSISLPVTEWMTPQQRRDHLINTVITMSYHAHSDNRQYNGPYDLPLDNDEEAIDVCSICLERFLDGDDVCMSQNKNCNHLFHLTCLVEWLLKSPTCPCCRRKYIVRKCLDKGLALPSTTSPPVASVPERDTSPIRDQAVQGITSGVLIAMAELTSRNC